jgi:uncharacterized protein YndB with AHSA1/START domain
VSKELSTRHDATVDATPDQIWNAIATGPGISTWFVGHTDIDGTTLRTQFGDDHMPDFHITDSDQNHRFAYRSDTAPDGRFVAYEYLIEGRDHAATTLRTVTSGFLPGDDWADEYEAMKYGTDLFFATLVEYLRHFPGRTATTHTTFGPPVTDWPAAWTALFEKLGLADPQPGDPVPAVGGHVYYRNPHTLAIRTPEALYRHIRGRHGALVTCTSHFERP